MKPNIVDLSNESLSLVFCIDNDCLRLSEFKASGFSWLGEGFPSGLFGVVVDGHALDTSNLAFIESREDLSMDGVHHTVLVFRGSGITVEQHVKVYAGSALVEMYPVIANFGKEAVLIERVDSLAITLPAGEADLFYYSGDWGSEFEPHHSRLVENVILQSRSGRSSKGNHPWFALSLGEKALLSASVAWSGNWAFRFEPVEGGGVRLSGGLNDWQFSKCLQSGESMEGAPVVVALGDSLNAISQQYARVGRKHWYPRNDFSSRMPVEWNHWWPYEDVEINETVFKQNVLAAEKMGFEICTLDAGWFGPSDAGTFWGHYRGDWHLVNDQRFPSGLSSLSDFTHAHGMKFGIWCEIEGLGKQAQVAIDHPDYVALRDGQRAGCVCFGSSGVQEGAYQTLARLITEYRADWIKLDFNLDPGAGCNRSDHGHQAGDGLYEHIRGYYRTLERVRADFPDVVLENCSSGGLRIDLGILRRTHMTFLSDPDWPVHDLQIFWGASTMLAPDVLLHWPFGDWRMPNPPPQQNFNPHDPNLKQKQWDYYTRMAMLGAFGFSQKLPELPGWMAKRTAEHNAIYQQHVRRFVKEADFYRLTDQPRRSGEGERWCAFQYSLPGGSEHLLFVFRLPGGEPERAIRLENLQPEQVYSIQGFEGEFQCQMMGRVLMEEGLIFSNMEEEESVLLHIQ